MNNLYVKYMTRNDCYTANRKITPKGIMIHSTATPGVMAKDWFSRWNKSFRAGEINRQVCVHAFLDDKEIWQYLPWNHRGWHAGGAANDTHIGIEICEPRGHTYQGATMIGYDVKKNEEYFKAAWENAINLCVFLCRQYNLTDKDIIGHVEGHRQGIASNHADPMHWFPKHGESMDTFRSQVRKRLEKTKPTFNVGDIVKIKDGAETYYPKGPLIPSWVKDTYHLITQTQSRGKPVLRGGKEAVLLGKKVHKRTFQESPGIMTWVDKDILEPIKKEEQLYFVQVGAFREKANAKAMAEKLKKAGFEAIIKK